jgi:glucose/arabinose dehydrogenase
MIKNFLLGIALIVLVGAIGYQYGPALFFKPTESDLPQYQPNNSNLGTQNTQQFSMDYQLSPQSLASDLEVPWEVLFLPEGRILVTQRPGQLLDVTTANKKLIYDGPADLAASAEGGLLGAVIHPEFETNRQIYLYETYDDSQEITRNRVVRFELPLDETSLINRTIIIDDIPGATYHDGGRLAFGPDDLLYVTTGDATQPDLAQNLDSLAGKILRLDSDGSIPEDNPFPSAVPKTNSKSPVYSYGHRNPQGLAWDRQGNLYSTEHGPSGLDSGQDELNLIVPGGNYGWPFFSGTQRPAPGQDSPIPNPQWPIAASGPNETWAPAGLSYWQGDLWFGGLRGQSLYQYQLESGQLLRHLVEDVGRLRTTVVTPDGSLAITTSNRDGRGLPQPNDDQILIYRAAK